MFADTVSHRLSNGVEARADGLYLSIHTGAIIDWWFDFPDSPAQLIALLPWEAASWAYKWPWKEARKYLLLKDGDAACALEHKALPKAYQTIACYPAGYELYPEDEALNRIVAILVDDAKAFDILHWCLTTLGGNDA